MTVGELVSELRKFHPRSTVIVPFIPTWETSGFKEVQAVSGEEVHYIGGWEAYYNCYTKTHKGTAECGCNEILDFRGALGPLQSAVVLHPSAGHRSGTTQ